MSTYFCRRTTTTSTDCRRSSSRTGTVFCQCHFSLYLYFFLPIQIFSFEIFFPFDYLFILWSFERYICIYNFTPPHPPHSCFVTYSVFVGWLWQTLCCYLLVSLCLVPEKMRLIQCSKKYTSRNMYHQNPNNRRSWTFWFRKIHRGVCPERPRLL